MSRQATDSLFAFAVSQPVEVSTESLEWQGTSDAQACRRGIGYEVYCTAHQCGPYGSGYCRAYYTGAGMACNSNTGGGCWCCDWY
jgi:hypothetical protein